MKKRLYRRLFRIFSYLSDKTNGAPFIVKYKLIIGTLIIGLASSCNGDKERTVSKKVIDRKPVNTTQITCYEAVAPDDTIDNQVNQTPKFDPPTITCYDTVVVDAEETIIRDKEIKETVPKP